MKNKHIFDTLVSNRQSIEPEYEFVNRYILPQRGPLYGNEHNWYIRKNRSYTDDAVQYCRTLASTLFSGLFPKKFFRPAVEGRDATDEEKLWFDSAEKKMHTELYKAKTKFGNTMFEKLQDICGFGNGVSYFIEDEDGDKVLTHIGMNEIYFSRGISGEKDIVAREFEMRGMDILKQFPNVSSDLKRQVDKDPMKKHKIVHMVIKNDKKKGKRYDSCYYEKNSFNELHKGSFYENPYLIGAWGHTPISDYSYSPAMMVKQDVLMYQQVRKALIQATQIKLRPPVMMSSDSTINSLNLTPNGINYGLNGRGEKTIQYLEISGTFQEALKLMEDTKDAIKQGFFIDSLIHKTGPQIRSAQEVVQRQEEQIRLMGPHISNLFSELINPLLERLFNMMLRNKEFDDIPESLAGEDVKFIFTSPLAKAYELDLPASVSRTFEIVGPFLQAQPQALDNFQIDDIIRSVGLPLGFPEKFLTPIEKRDESRAAAQQAQAEQQQIAQAQSVASSAAELQKSGINVVPGEEKK